MRNSILMGSLVLLAMGSGYARADDCHGQDCKPPTKEVCFNLVCHYADDGNQHECTAASTFTKRVTLDGGEVTDDSDFHDNPALEVTCGNKVIFNNSARRYTGLLGTRIQGQEGPDPAITLPRGELHSGADETSGGHYSPSMLHLWNEDDVKGECFIWTGAP